ncbi:hypothetical protein [Aliikangiella sp. IMCC44632]
MEPSKVQFALYFLVSTLLVVFLAAGTIQNIEQDDKIKEYSGVYVREFEYHGFGQCGGNESWWVSSASPADYDLKIKYMSIKDHDSRVVFMRLRGEVSELGNYGHLDMSKREIIVHEILETDAQIPEGCIDLRTEH